MVALVLADAILEKFGGDTMADIDAALTRYRTTIASRLSAPLERV
jgi:hypothetical protein